MASDKEEANQKFDLVMSQIRSEGMPQSPYIALLLIWANRQKLAGEKLNEALLLQNVMEHLLGRADFRTAKRGELGAVGKEIILQHVAKKITHNGQGLDENALITELVDFFELRKLPSLRPMFWKNYCHAAYSEGSVKRSTSSMILFGSTSMHWL